MLPVRTTSILVSLARLSAAAPACQMSDAGHQQDPRDLFGELGERVLDKVGGQLEVKKQNAFKLFNLEQKLRIDQRKLQAEMRKLQNILHPDRFVYQPKPVQDLSSHLSAMVNEYYSMLRNPYERGKYLLALQANKSLSEIDSLLDKVELDEQFLAKMMEMRECIEDRISMDQRQQIESELKMELQELTATLEGDLKAGDMQAILTDLAKMKFLASGSRINSDNFED